MHNAHSFTAAQESAESTKNANTRIINAFGRVKKKACGIKEYKQARKSHNTTEFVGKRIVLHVSLYVK